MHDLKLIRETPQLFDNALARRGLEAKSAEILVLDESIRKSTTELQELQARRNEIAKEIPAFKKEGKNCDALFAEAEKIKANIPSLEAAVAASQAKLEDILSAIPNLVDDSVPDGKEDADDREEKKVGAPTTFSFKPKEHFELGADLDVMDFEQTAKFCGSRFVTLKGKLARMERALANFMLDIHTSEFGYTEMVPPALVKSQAVYGVGQLPKFEEDLFKTTNDYYLISTSEVVLTNMVADTITPEEKLPLRYTAYTPCFRSEAGSAGRDTTGMIRMHQFSKVEMVSITAPEHSVKEHDRMLSAAETVLQRLGLPYRVITLCTANTGFASRKTYDIEVWLPGQDRYREIASCSNCGDFQARRLKARYKEFHGHKNNFVHTLNSSGLPIGRTIIAIMENYQNEDGSITIPECLRPYMGGLEKISKEG